eukprot:TRINITY_DN18187_c0_g1_i1.p1 TRINITY_DN18187_c0_g1~~TRINITY_DN18187_c0_g1_i1.p1  ORF type:complete len:291 (-),score=43.56 TRINITY_DN18187_c0_g1_i1:24-896(-)
MISPLFHTYFCCGRVTEEEDEKLKTNFKNVQLKEFYQKYKIFVRGIGYNHLLSTSCSTSRDVNIDTLQAPWKEDKLLPPQRQNKIGKKCIVLDLDETLVHSSFKPISQCDFVVSVNIEDQIHQVYVTKRPFVDEYLKRCGELFEVVVFTASQAKYADAVLNLLDVNKVIDWRLYRESCTPHNGGYVKDMRRMGRDISQIMIVDNSPHSYAFTPENAFPCGSWFFDNNDRELFDFIPYLEQLEHSSDIRDKLKDLSLSPITTIDLTGGYGGETKETETETETETQTETDEE